MKVSLFDFQRDALHQLRDKIVAARKFATTDNPQAIAFSAPTGSGKTIIMTALFEAILDQPDDELEHRDAKDVATAFFGGQQPGHVGILRCRRRTGPRSPAEPAPRPGRIRESCSGG